MSCLFAVNAGTDQSLLYLFSLENCIVICKISKFCTFQLNHFPFVSEKIERWANCVILGSDMWSNLLWEEAAQALSCIREEESMRIGIVFMI